ncbi:hypothetical protein K402DRAFT_420831 [Aulographum hederae CBS 113979]|uniref:Uncharacterized protein n=1 Tax=Aulographum hederae CBS 113979 TaxID=1176131 RepID=A0A6G1H0L9_9PEZI|nr:hypothetical protein K402DRAFT_420831 [Aulographum hederae CBS 113979]
MPFRENVRKVMKFRKASSASSSNNSNSNTPTPSSKGSSTMDFDLAQRLKDPNVYQPGEKMPPLKYRRPVAKEHKEKLEAFSFGTAWRRKSHQSIYSPKGSRMPSRGNSFSTLGRKSLQMRRADQHRDRLTENADNDADTRNVGGSRQPSQDSTTSQEKHRHRKSRIEPGGPVLAPIESQADTQQTGTPTKHYGESRDSGKGTQMQRIPSPMDMPFSQDDLTLAMKRSRLDVPS